MPENQTICQPTPSYEMHVVKQIQRTEADIRVRVILGRYGCRTLRRLHAAHFQLRE